MKLNSKNKTLVIIGISTAFIAALFVSAYLYFENKENKNKIKELEEDKLKLILESLKSNPNIGEEVVHQIQKLILEFKHIDEKISNELAQALQLLQISQVENAIEDLVKIIEHLLTVHYQNHKGFNSWLKENKLKITLHNLLKFCKHEKKIDDIEFQFFVAIKAIRNKEDHTLDLKLDKYISASGLITAIGGILKLASIVYPKRELHKPSVIQLESNKGSS